MDQEIPELSMSQQVSETNLFNRVGVFKNHSSLFELIDTKFILVIGDENKMHWRLTSGAEGIINKAVPFEDVFDSVTASIQEGFAFHLDLFKE